MLEWTKWYVNSGREITFIVVHLTAMTGKNRSIGNCFEENYLQKHDSVQLAGNRKCIQVYKVKSCRKNTLKSTKIAKY